MQCEVNYETHSVHVAVTHRAPKKALLVTVVQGVV